MAAYHAWEHEDPGDHAWENSDNSGSDDEADPEKNPEAAASGFLDVLVDLYMTSSISAQTFCVLCWFAAKSGMPGLVHQYGKKPGGATGHYQRHLNSSFDFKEINSRLYTVKAPGQTKDNVGRSSVDLPVLVPHEALNREFDSDPTIGF